MRIGVIQASSQAPKNQIIYDAVVKYAPKKSEVINFGCTIEENEKYSNIYTHSNCYHCMQCSYKIVIYLQKME